MFDSNDHWNDLSLDFSLLGDFKLNLISLINVALFRLALLVVSIFQEFNPFHQSCQICVLCCLFPFCLFVLLVSGLILTISFLFTLGSTCFFLVSYAETLLMWDPYSFLMQAFSDTLSVQFSSVQSLSRVRLLVTPWIAAHQASLSIKNSWSLSKPMSIESVLLFSHLTCRPLLLLPPIPPSIRVFSNESTVCISWPKYGNFSFSISPSNGNPGLISFRMDWLDILAVQGTLKSSPTP